MSTFFYAGTTRRRRNLARRLGSTGKAREEIQPDPSLAADQRIAFDALLDSAEESEREATDALADNEFVGMIAALVPAETLALHAFFLAMFTETTDAGTEITDASSLKWAFAGLILFTALVFVAGKVKRDDDHWGFEKTDLLRLLIPVLAFIAWSVLLGTSAITPLLGDSQEVAMIGAAVGGAALLVLAKATTPPAEGG